MQINRVAAAEAQICKYNKVFNALESERDEELSNDKDASSFLLEESYDTTLNFNVSINQSGLGRYVTSKHDHCSK